MRAAVLNSPAGYLEKLKPLPQGTTLSERAGKESLDFVQVFASQRADLDKQIRQAAKALKPEGLLWVSYKKGGQKAGTDLNRDLLWKAMEKHGFTGVTLVALDEDWSAMRFRRPDQVGK